MKEHHVRAYYPKEMDSKISELAIKYESVANGNPLIGRGVRPNQRFTFKTSNLANQFSKDVNSLVEAVEEKAD
jgi:hypothetical protein